LIDLPFMQPETSTVKKSHSDFYNENKGAAKNTDDDDTLTPGLIEQKFMANDGLKKKIDNLKTQDGGFVRTSDSPYSKW